MGHITRETPPRIAGATQIACGENWLKECFAPFLQIPLLKIALV
jgi:hypothetical protein